MLGKVQISLTLRLKKFVKNGKEALNSLEQSEDQGRTEIDLMLSISEKNNVENTKKRRLRLP